MAQLAIKGHATRGKEVIELLEMLGGKNEEDYVGGETTWLYTINNGIIDCNCPSGKYIIYTIEEFLDKFPYKVGDNVLYKVYGICSKIKTMHWNVEMEHVFYRLDSNKLFVATEDELKAIKEQL